MIEFLKGSVTPKDWMAVGVILSITALLVAAFVFVLQSNQNAVLAKIDTDHTKLKADLKAAQDLEKNLDDLKKRDAKVDKLIEEFELRLPDEEEIPALVTGFENLAADLNLRVKLTPPTAPIRDDRKETIPYSVEATGTFHQIATFINELERHQRYLAVSNLEIREEDEGVSEATFTLSTYRFIQTSAESAQ